MLLKWHLDFNWSGLNWLFREAFGFICRDQATTGFLGYIFKFAITSSIIFLQRKPYDQVIPRVITGAQTLEWWRISWCAWKPPSRRPTRRRGPTRQQGESLLCMIVWSNARTAPWSVGKPWDFLFVCFSKVWFNSLCSDLEGLVPAKAQSLLLKKIEGLEQVMNKRIGSIKTSWHQEERESILAKMQGAETPDIDEQNQVAVESDNDFFSSTDLLDCFLTICSWTGPDDAAQSVLWGENNNFSQCMKKMIQ